MQTPEEGKVRVAFAELIDLAAEKVGGKALIANDEFFAPKENLLKPGRGVFIPDTCSLEGCFLKEDLLDFANAKDIAWQEILPRAKLQPSHQHFYEAELRAAGPFTDVRLNFFPDGGISRLRVHGRPS